MFVSQHLYLLRFLLLQNVASSVNTFYLDLDLSPQCCSSIFASRSAWLKFAFEPESPCLGAVSVAFAAMVVVKPGATSAVKKTILKKDDASHT